MENLIAINKYFLSSTELENGSDHFLQQYDRILKLHLHYPESDAIALQFQNWQQYFKDSV
jgi:hypothetical protein